MKKLIIGNSGSVIFDPEVEEISDAPSQREAISRIYLVEEPMEVVVKRNDKNYTMTAKKDDLVIKFYDQDYEYPAIVVRSKDWTKNIKGYNKKMEERRLKVAGAICAEECDVCSPA